MSDHVKNFNERLIGLFEIKVDEFTKHSEEHPVTAGVTKQLVGLYQDLIEVMRK